MKKYAFFLPQFHEIPENNEWWGKRFTEWTNVKKAVPLFKGHKQPKKPFDNEYYNLLDKDTVIKQTQLMHEYKVDGLIYYHYYFCGKKLLEKPAENLLHWKDINQNFFFCWANHSWKKTWDGSSALLQEQIYGNINDWNEHFNYLLPFFQDSRYEKKDNKPLFMIFNANFPEKKDIFEFFDSKCRDYGFNGIYLIESYGGKYPEDYSMFRNNITSVTQKIFFREMNVSNKLYVKRLENLPYRTVRFAKKGLCHLFNRPYVLQTPGNMLYKAIINIEPYEDNIIHGLFFEWDNTPRHGYRGHVISPPSKKMFFRAMNKMKNYDYVFFNAWNEWCEGMILEPTKENGYKYLEWIKEWSDNNDNR